MATLLLTIGTPQDNDWAKTSPPGPLKVSGTASLTDLSVAGRVDVTITVGADTYTPTVGAGKFVHFSQTLTPPAAWDLKVKVDAGGTWSVGGSGGSHEESTSATKTVTLRADNTAPALTVSSPANGAHFVGSAQGFAVPVSGTATDQESGVRVLTWTLEDGSSGQIPVAADGSWQTSLPLAPGPHVVTFTAQDRVGNASTASLQVQIDAPADIFATTTQDYLRALLEFATQPADKTGAISRVANAGANLTKADLEGALYQAFTALDDAINTRKALEEISCVRMAIEVLRQYLLAHPITDAQQSQLAAAELQYRSTAYFALLQQIGTSFDEVRLIRTADAPTRQAVADRLGITLRPARPDELDSLLLDPASLSEASLETLFGLVDTTRDPLDDGVRVSDVKWLSGWNFTGVNPGRNTDADGFVYLNMNPISIGRQPIGVVSGPLRVGVSTQAHGGTEVALGTADSTLTVALGAVQNSGLTGRLKFVKAPTEQIQMSVAPSVLTWKTNHLRELWKLQGLGPGQPATPPVIDPDLLATTDFLNPDTSDAAFALYLERQNTVQAWSQALQSKRPDLNALTAGVLIDGDHSAGWTVNDLLSLDQSRTGGRDISDDLSKLNLDVDAFDRLVAIGRIYTSAGTAQLLESEWTDVVSILVQAQKRQAYPAWRADEAATAHGVTLSPDWFVADISTAGTPDLPTWRATASARNTLVRVLQGRRQQQDSASQTLRQAVDAVEGVALPMFRDALIDAIQVPMTIERVYGTGLDADGRTLVDGAVDPHWSITAGPALSGTAPAFATVSAYPVGNPWIANDADSRWISPQPSEQTGGAAGAYTYSTAFDLTGFDPSTTRIVASVAVDDSITQVRLNGGNLNLTAVGFGAFTVMNIVQGFVDGRNVMEFDVSNAGTTVNPTGLRVQIAASGTYRPGADWLSERLLIDIGATSQKTTRLEQAVETMQELFFVLRSQGFAGMPELSAWTLNAWTLADPAPPFDAEWKWMGSYSTWTAAMNIFLFPENVLLPSLRADSPIWPATRAFRDFLASVRDAAPLTPDGVSPLIAAYRTALQTSSQYPDLPQELQSASLTLADLTDNLSDDQLKTRAGNLAQWWQNHRNETPPSQKHINYLAEVFFFVPLHLALQLQQAGQFSSALDWYRKIYAVSLPAARRKIWYGLIAEESLPMVYQQVSLAGSLNPHDIVGFNPGSTISAVVGNRARAYSRFTLMSLVQCLLDFADSEFTIDSAESSPRARSLYLQALDLLGAPDLQRLPGVEDRIPANDVLASLEQRARLNLTKLRSGRTFSGLLRSGHADTLSATSAPVQPTQYRYATLIDRARQLCALAQQAESSFLASLEKADAETYTELKANQDLEVANANVVLQNLITDEAEASTALAEDQFARAQIEIDHYTDLLSSDIPGLEMASIAMHIGEAANQGLAAGLYGAVASSEIGTAITTQGFSAMLSSFLGTTGSAGAAAQAASATAQALAATGGVLSALASYEEKQKDWQYQLDLARADWYIAGQQASIAHDHEATARQQQTIATIQSRHASDVVTFLTTQKFTNAALYEWMSGILQQVYSYLLQQATSLARLAQTQLAFERQTPPLNIVQTYYWQAPSDTVAAPGSSGQPSDTRGLTGSARLLAAITQLDQYAFATDQRKLQLTKSISLAQWDPFAFRTFQTTGVLRFATTSTPFDQDFPGHYLRVIKRVRMSLIALVPAVQGIHATLRHTGISRVIVGGDWFSEIVLTREPQTVALTSPINATGLFELDVQPELLLPFEGLGVAGSWEFVMPKAANQFDYGSIADLVITLDYTALDSPDYRQQVIQRLGRSMSADRAYSLRQDFADAWYELNNPLQSATPMKVVFESERVDFPVNIDDGTLTLSQLLLFFVGTAGQAIAAQPTLTLDGTDGTGNPKTVSGAATTIDGVISTRRGNAAAWSAMIGMSPVGKWTLDLSNPDVRQLFLTGLVEDILFVVTYAGELPESPG